MPVTRMIAYLPTMSSGIIGDDDLNKTTIKSLARCDRIEFKIYELIKKKKSAQVFLSIDDVLAFNTTFQKQ